ncbi:hypothetical protein Emed_003008 [Eimeria media]
MWVRDTISLTDELRREDRRAVQEDLMAAAEETIASEDKVLRPVWQMLFELGSLLYDGYAAWKKLEKVDIKKHADALNSGFYDPFEESEFSSAVRACLTSEVRLEQHAARVEDLFTHVVRAVSLLHNTDFNQMYSNYAPLGDFLRELHVYTIKRKGRTDLIHRTALLEAFASQGDQAAGHLVTLLRAQLQELVENLRKQLQEVVRTAVKCHEAGLLFRGAVTLLKALYEATF